MCVCVCSVCVYVWMYILSIWTYLFSPDLYDERCPCEIVQELLGNWVHGEVVGEVKVWVPGTRNTFCSGILFV